MGGGSRVRILLVLGLLLLLIGGAWWLLRGDAPSADDDDTAGSGSDAAAAPAQAAPPAEEAPDPASLAREAAPDGAEALLPRSPSDGLLVKVVDAASKAPLPDAEVLWLYPEQWLHGPGSDGLHFGWAREIAPRVLTGADGIAVLPHLTGSVWIGACTANASQSGYLTPSRLDSPVMIALLPEVTQAVHVQDASGRPVEGARVGLLQGQWVRVTAETDANGVALLHDLQTVRSTGAPQPSYFLTLIGPTASEQRIAYDFDAPPAAPPVLQIGPWGEVEILVQDQNGQPLTGVWPVQLRVNDPQRSGWEGTEENADALTLPARDGRVLFPHAALELQLQAALRRGHDERAVYARFAGPRLAGERVTAVIQLKDENPQITLRVLGPDGAPMPGLRLYAQYLLELGPSSQMGLEGKGLTLDAASRMTLEAVNEEEYRGKTPPGRRLLELEAVDPRSGAAWSAQMLVHAKLAPGLMDLGEVRLEPTPLIVEGRVRTSDNQPLREYPQIQIQVRDAQGEWQPTRFRAAGVSEGRFRILGRPPPGDLRIQAWLGSGSRAEVPFQLGDTGVEFVLDPVALLKGSLLLDPDVPWRTVLLDFKKSEQRMRTGIAEDGAWSIRTVPDGVYTMALQETWSQRILWSVEGLAFTGGQPADPSVLQVDLRGKIRPILIEVVDPEGRPIENWQIRLHGAEQKYWRDNLSQYGNRILSTGAPLDFDLRADRFAPLEVRGVTADQRLTLKRGIAVRVAILSPAPLPDDLEYGVGLHDEANDLHGHSYLDASGAGEVWVPVAGTYRLVVTARGRHGDRSMTSDIRLDAETRARRDVVIPAEGLPDAIPIGLHLENLEEVRKRHNE